MGTLKKVVLKCGDITNEITVDVTSVENVKLPTTMSENEIAVELAIKEWISEYTFYVGESIEIVSVEDEFNNQLYFENETMSIVPNYGTISQSKLHDDGIYIENGEGQYMCISVKDAEWIVENLSAMIQAFKESK